jgi:multiple sugar transport system ATP-binding protein
MNLYEAALTEGCAAVRIGSQEIALSQDFRNRRPELAAYADRPVILGVRPENLPAVNGTVGPEITARVDLVESLGSELQVHFSLDAKRVQAEGTSDPDELISSGAGVARVAPHQPATPGDQIRLSVNVDALHFFDPADGNAIRH